MPVSEIAKLRDCGQIRFHVIYDYPNDLNRVLQMCHLKPEAEHLLEIERGDAIRVLTRCLHREPAYETELMSEGLAIELAEKFIREFSDGNSQFFTNGPWFDPQRWQHWRPLTESIFDGGVLIASNKGNRSRHVCLWFEDED